MQLNPQSKKIVGAINQAKKEQQEGTFDAKRQRGFLTFMEQQESLQTENFPPTIWRDLFNILEGVLSTILIVTTVKYISPEHEFIHTSIIKLMLRLLTADPSRI